MAAVCARMPTEITDPVPVPSIGSVVPVIVPVANQAARLALTLQAAAGNTIRQTDNNSTWMLVAGGDPSEASDWLAVGGGGAEVLELTEIPEDTRVPTREKRALEFAGTTITESGNLKLRFTNHTGTVETMVAVGEGDFGSDIASKVFEAWGEMEASGVHVEWEFSETTVYWEALGTGRDVFFAVEILEEDAVANDLPHSQAIAVGSGAVAGTAGLLHQDARVTIDEDVSVWRCVQASGGYKWIPVSGAYFWNRDELRWERGFVGGRTIQTETL